MLAKNWLSNSNEIYRKKEKMEDAIEKLVKEFPVGTEIEVTEMEPGTDPNIGKVGEKGKVLGYYVSRGRLYCSFSSKSKTLNPKYVKKV